MLWTCWRRIVSMPHAAFYVVELMKEKTRRTKALSFNAARGFLCGGTCVEDPRGVRLCVSMPHAAFYVVERRRFIEEQSVTRCFNAARGFLCGGTFWYIGSNLLFYMFQCRTRLSMWWNISNRSGMIFVWGFNAARGFLCGGTSYASGILGLLFVSMPHAAFYVVEQQYF